MAGVGETQAWKKGEELWTEDPISGKRKLEGLEARQSAWAATVSPVSEWKEHFDTVELGKTRTVDETEVVDLLLKGDGFDVTLSLDAKSHLPVQQSFKQKSPMGEVPITITFEDYREVEGVKIPHRTLTSMSIATAEQTIETWEANVEVDESRFSPP